MTFDSTSLLRQYASLQPLHQLQIPYSALQLARNQPALISSLITHPILVKFPPAKTYKRGFWKVLVALLEEGCRTPEGQAEELEVAEEIYEVYVEAMQQSQIEGTDEEGGGKPKTHKTFFFELTRGPSSIQFATKEETPASLTLLESLLTIQAGTTGLRTWGASLRLAETLLDRPTILFSDQSNTMRRVMELGSGVGFLSGVVGIIGKGHAVANAERESGEGPSGDGTSGGSTRVWATDLDANVLESLEGNVKLNGLEDIIKVERLDWEDALASSDPESRSDLRQLIASADPDLILAADVVYDPSLIPLLVSTLRLLLHPASASEDPYQPSHRSKGPPRTCSAYIASTIRNPETFDAFVQHAVDSGLVVSELDISDVPHVFYGSTGEGGKGSSSDGEIRVVEMT